jgi:RNA binding exosome subunit
VKSPFLALHARAFCHASEDLDRVKLALSTAVGTETIKTSKTEGHHGNPIIVLEAVVEDDDGIRRFFERLGTDDLETIARTLTERIDDGCNLFIRIDKQSAVTGKIRLGKDDDVLSVRLRVRAYPAKFEVASRSVHDFIEGVLATRDDGQ